MAFAFSGPTSIEVRQGESATAVFRILATSRPYRNVSLTISGLPSGVSAQFSPVSGKPSFNAILALRASATSVVGTFTVTVTARDAKSSKSITLMGTLLRALNRPEPTIEPGDIHVATTGNDTTGDGSIGNPYATIQKAHDVAVAGDLIYVRGGTYTLTSTQTLTKDGSSGNMYRLFAYPGETPILDGSSLGAFAACLSLSSANWWWVKGLEVTNAPMFGIQLIGTASDNIIELCVAHHNIRTASNGAGIGVGITGGDTPARNLVLNCDAHHNGLVAGTGGDGFGCNYTTSGTNTFRGCRSWRNHDDGIDLWEAAATLIEDCWIWENGYDDTLTPTGGDGNGFKLGGNNIGGGHTVRRNLSWNNFANGFDQNSANDVMTLYNNTASGNANTGGTSNYAFSTAKAHVLRNNIAYDPNTVSFNAAVDDTQNSWNSDLSGSPTSITVDATTFTSVDFTANTGARQADGSLPSSTFLHLNASAGSTHNAVDKGVDVGLAFNGSFPDLGAYET